MFVILRNSSLLANQHFAAKARHSFLCGAQLVSLIRRSAHWQTLLAAKSKTTRNPVIKNVEPSGHSSTRCRRLWDKCPNRRVEHRPVLLLQWHVSLCSWLHLSNCIELLHSKQVWGKLLLGLFARRLNCHEDSYETDLWYSGNNNQWCLDDLLLRNLWDMQDGTRNPHQEWRHFAVTRHKGFWPIQYFLFVDIQPLWK